MIALIGHSVPSMVGLDKSNVLIIVEICFCWEKAFVLVCKQELSEKEGEPSGKIGLTKNHKKNPEAQDGV